jgi:hypothetical protein
MAILKFFRHAQEDHLRRIFWMTLGAVWTMDPYLLIVLAFPSLNFCSWLLHVSYRGLILLRQSAREFGYFTFSLGLCDGLRVALTPNHSP